MAAPILHAAPPAALRIVPLDTLTAIHHRSSGQTHLVAPPVPEIIAVLHEGARTLDELLATLTDRFDLRDADSAALAARIDELIASGLVHAA